MKKALLAVGVVALLVGMVAGCGKKPGAQDAGNTDGKIVLDVVSFQGGFKLDFFEYAAREYEKLHPNVTIKVTGNPRVWEQLRPRFVKGTPPDLTWPGWGMDYWGLVAEDKVLPMDDYLQTKAYGQDKKWIDTFDMRLLDKGKYNGHYYIMPYNQNVFGWWYNVDMFKKHGWQPPKTYDELLVLCEKIKAAGIAPLTYQGRYPSYMLQGFLFPWVISAGGLQAFNDAQNLKPGSWKSPAFLQAATMVAELRDKGYFEKGAMGMSHTEAQMEFVLGKAAMIPCGTWIGSEMKDQLPKGFRMAFINPPVIKGGKGDPTITSAGVETWIIPKEGKNHDTAADFFKFMTSLEMAKKFVAQKNTLMAIKDSDTGEIPPDLVGAAACARKASALWTMDYATWYQTLRTDQESAMAALLNKEITPAECIAKMEAAAQRTAKDSTIPKHQVK